MDLTSVVEQLDAEQSRITLLKRILTDGYFFQRVQRLADDALGLAHEIIEEDQNRWNNIPIEDVDFSVRTFNCLKKAGLNTLGQVVSRTAAELLEPAIRNFGRRSLDEVVEKLAQYDLKLREP